MKMSFFKKLFALGCAVFVHGGLQLFQNLFGKLLICHKGFSPEWLIYPEAALRWLSLLPRVHWFVRCC